MSAGTSVSPADAPGVDLHVDCAVIVITYNSADHIESFLDSLPAATADRTYRCIVVDNQSADGTREILRARPDITLVEADGNLGYSGAINVGRSHVGSCDSVLIANPDIELRPGCVSVLCDALEDRSVGVTVPRITDASGAFLTTLRYEPTVLGGLGEALFGNRFATRPSWLTETVRVPGPYGIEHDADWTSGALLCVSRACDAAVGDWDEKRFFLYAEETDFARRVRQHGFRIRYIPAAQAVHDEGGSGRRPMLDALGSVNRIRYYEKYHSPLATYAYRATIVLKHMLRWWDRDDILALRYVCRRSTWTQLPGGRP